MAINRSSSRARITSAVTPYPIPQNALHLAPDAQFVIIAPLVGGSSSFQRNLQGAVQTIFPYEGFSYLVGIVRHGRIMPHPKISVRRFEGAGLTAAAPSITLGMAMETPGNPNELAGLAPDEEKMARDEHVVETGFWRKVRSKLGKVPFLEDAVAAYYCATDRNTPDYVKAVLVAAIAYFVIPTDVMPDFVVGFGYTDDAAVLIAALSVIRGHLKPEHRSRARDFLDGDDQLDNQSG